ncbi:hypothetical protein AAU33_14485 [Listeria monocytogenes]|nr:hypothetical protein [Listeria monocytogenes]
MVSIQKLTNINLYISVKRNSVDRTYLHCFFLVWKPFCMLLIFYFESAIAMIENTRRNSSIICELSLL